VRIVQVCEEEVVSCAYGEGVCAVRLPRREMTAHQDDSAMHWPLVVQALRGLEGRVRELEAEKLMVSNPMMQQARFQRIETQVAALEKKVTDRFSGLENALEERLGEIEAGSDELEARVRKVQAAEPSDDVPERLRRCEELLYDLERCVSLRLVFKVKETDLLRIVHSPVVSAAGGRSINLTFGPSHLMWAGSEEGLRVAGTGTHGVWLFVAGGSMPATAKITFELMADGPGSHLPAKGRPKVSVIHRCEADINAINKGYGIPNFVQTSALDGASSFNNNGVITLIADVLIK